MVAYIPPKTKVTPMRNKTFLGLALATALAIGTTAAIAAPHDGHGRHGQRSHHGEMMMLHKLNLSDAQQASVKQIISTHREQNQASWRALRQQRSAFESMTPNQVGYQAAAASLAQAEGQATQARVRQMANLRAQIYAVLTPAQQAQAATLQAEVQARRQQRRQSKAQPSPSADQ